MLNITITTSMQTKTFVLDLPITDNINLHYDDCKYCETIPVRRESVELKRGVGHQFCRDSHRVIFSQKRIAQCLTA